MRLLGRAPSEPVRLSFGSWEALEGRVVTICHADWRGVRTAAYGHRVPVVEVREAGQAAGALVGPMVSSGVEILVIQGFPPGSDRLIEEARAAGLGTAVVLHSSMAQHGGETAEAEVTKRVLELANAGALDKIGFVKEGLAEVFQALGFRAQWVPNRLPPQPDLEPISLGQGLHVGVFAEPFWRKNVITQLGAVVLLDGTAHLIRRPEGLYLGSLPIVEHGLLPYEEFLRVQGSVDLNLYVTLSECYPLSPLESYAAGVPCLTSRTSSLFRDDPVLWELTTIDRLDDPTAIAEAARHLLEHREEAVGWTRDWIERWDRIASHRWEEFVA